MVSSDAGTYRCSIKEIDGSSATIMAALSTEAQLSVTAGPTINFASLTLCAGATSNLSVTSNNTTGDSWGSSDPTVATVNSSGQVTPGVDAGTATITYTDGDGCSTTTTVTVNALPTTTITSSDVDNTICDGESITLTSDQSGSGYTYKWFKDGSVIPGETSSSYLATVSGSYTVEVTNSSTGCIATTPGANAIAVVENSNPVIALSSSTNVACFGESTGAINISVSGGDGNFTFAWSDGASYSATSEDISNVFPGVYSVTVTDGNNCSANTSYNITQPPTALSATTSSTNVSSSGGSDGSATVTPSGGTAGYTYLWSDGQTNATATNLTAGNYSVVIKDANLCSITKNFTVTEPSSLSATATAINNVSCNNGSDGSASVSVTGGTSPYTYSWNTSPIQTNSTATNLAAGTYTVTITDFTNVVTTANVTISEPSALSLSITATDVSCVDDVTGALDATVTGGTPNYTFAWSNSSSSEDQTGLGTGTYSLTVTDDNGCQISSSATISVLDNIAPTVTTQDITVQMDALGSATITAAMINDGSTDNCAISSLSLDITSFDCDDLGPNTVILNVTDNNGNSATGTATVTVVDNIDPTITAPAAVTVNVDAGACSTALSNVTLGTPTTGDNCSVATTTNDAPVSFPLGATTVTWTVTDGSGNTATSTQVVTVVDNIDPTITAPAAVTVNVDAGACSTALSNVTLGTPTTGDNCSVATTTNDAPVSFPLGATTVTWTVTDGSGNTATSTQVVTVVDNIDPVAVAQDITVFLDANGQASITTADVDNGSSDNCTFTLGLDITSFDCTNLGANTVTLTATDGSSNDHSATATVTVVDNIDPVAVAQDITVFLDANGQASITTADVDNGSSDNCTFTLGLDITSFDCTNLGANTVTLTATDGSSNDHSATATVTVVDNIDPVAVAQDITVFLDANGQASITTADVDNGSSDNCTFTLGLDITSFDCTNLGANTVTLTATDGSSNDHSATATVTVVDNIDPTITAPAAVTVNVDAGACSTALSNVTLGTPTTGDNCSVATTTNDAPVSFPLGATTVTWTVTDGAGNTTTTTQVVTVIDNIDPLLTCPNDLTVYGVADSTLTSVSWSAATATDNCSIDTIYSDIQTGHYFPLGITTVTYVAIDGSGNSDTCSFSITVVDTVSPVITGCPSAITQNNDTDSCGAVVNWAAPTYYDNSDYYTVSASHASGDYFPVGTTTVTITVADSSGNSSVCEFDVTVEDAQVPYVVPFSNVAVTLGTDGMYNLAVTTVDSASYDNCGIANRYLSDTFFNCNDVPAATTWLVLEDVHGNKDSALVNIQVSLPSTPVLTTVATVSDVLCHGDSTGFIQVAVSGGVAPYAYNWSSGSNVFEAINLPIGSYWFEVTDTNGCYTSDTLVMNEPAPLAVSTVKSIYPGGYNVSINGTSDGSITTTASGGITPYTFDWNTGAFTTQDLTGISAGIYSLVMTDSNGCTIAVVDTLTEPTPLVITASSLQSVVCPDDTAGIALAVASGAVPPYQLTWDFGSTVDYVTGLSYGIYTVTATDTNGAVATDTVLIDALDYDCDGIYNVDEGGSPNGGGGLGDVDGDGIPNQEDEDSDGDGLPDDQEFDYDNDGVGFDDCDGDGIPNFLDPDLCELLVPAVFTPNDDGDNDYWEILGIMAFPDNNVKIFNRWGELVYSKEGYNNEFNGRANTRTQMNGGDGLLPTGTYYYVVKVYETGDIYTGYVYITK